MKALQIEDAVQMLNNTNVVYSRAGGGAGSILLVKTDNNNSIFLLRKSKKVVIFADCLQKKDCNKFYAAEFLRSFGSKRPIGRARKFGRT